jgi:hypothetical protein
MTAFVAFAAVALAAPPPAWVETPHGSVRLGYSSFCSAGACVTVAEAVDSCRGAPPVVVRPGERVRFRLAFAAHAAELRAPASRPVSLGSGRTFGWRSVPSGAVTLAVSGAGGLEASYTACLISRSRPRPAPARETALAGVLLLSPAFPVCVVGRPCTRPIGGATLDFTRAGGNAGSTVTDVHGRYRIALAPGTYGVTLRGRKQGDPGRGLAPSTIRVPPVAAAQLDLAYDSGIR